MPGLFRRPPQPTQRLRRITAESPTKQGAFTADAIIQRGQSGSFTVDALIFAPGDWIAPPANTAAISASPTLTLTSPDATDNTVQQATLYPAWFQIQLDTSSAFNTGNLKTYRQGDGQGTWEYHDGSSWVAMPPGGMPLSAMGNQVRFTVPDVLSNGVWYRRYRYQIHGAA